MFYVLVLRINVGIIGDHLSVSFATILSPSFATILSFACFSPENLLGDGCFGRVYRARYKNQTVAVKVYSQIGDISPHKLLRQEVSSAQHR